MADENIDNLSESAQEGAYSLREFVRAISAGTTISEEKLKSFARANGMAVDSLLGFVNAYKAAKQTLVNMGSMAGAVGKGNTSFSVLNSTISSLSNVVGELLGTIPLVGDALKGLTLAAGQATTYMLDQYQSAYSAFEQLGQVGSVGAQGIEDVRTQLKELGMPIEAMSAIVARNSQRLAGLSGTVLDASKQFTSTAGAMKKADEAGNRLDMQLRVLGYSSDEIADTMIQYADLQRRFGAQQTLSNDQLAAGTLAYGKELDAIAKLTGMNRKQLQSEMDQMMLNERFAAKIRDMQLNGQEAAAKELQAAVLAQMAMGNKQMGSAIMAAATGFYTTPEAKAAAATIPGFMENVGALANGSMKMNQFTQNLQDSAIVAEQQYRGLAQAVGNNTVATQMYNEQLNLATRDAGKIGEAINGAYNAIDQGTQFPDESTKNLAGARADLEQAASNISLLATEFETVTAGVKTFAAAINDVTEWVHNNIANSTDAQYARSEAAARETLAQIQDTEQQLRDHLAGINPLSEEKVTELNNQLAQLNKHLADQKARFWDSTMTSSRPSTPENADLFRNMTETNKRLENELYEQPVIFGDNSIGKQIRDAFVDEEQLAREKEEKRKPYNPEDKGTLRQINDSINNWFRDTFGDEKPNEQKDESVAPPAKVSAPEDNLSTMDKVGNWLYDALGGDPAKIRDNKLPETNQSKAYGGIATGPRSGYQATLHGTEAVIPLEGSKIPVEIKDTRDMKPQIDLMERQIAKLDAVIDAIQKHTAVSEKMFRSNYS